MKSFVITEEQIAGIIGGLMADELSWRFKRHVDFLTIASWTPETPLGPDGVNLSAEERDACAERIRCFFCTDPDALNAGDGEKISDWADKLGAAVVRRLTGFAFTPAGRDSRTQSCVHAADAIFSEAGAVANLLYGRRRLLSMVAPHSLMGFVTTVLTPNLQQIPALDARGMAPEPLKKALKFGDVLVATPNLWRYIIGEGVTAPDNTMGVYFGETMTPDLAADMRKAGFGGQRELYGSTETGMIGWRDSPTEPFVLFDQWKRIDDDLVRISPAGENAKMTSMDILAWAGKRNFRLAGRFDGAVQVGAVNVFPVQIQKTLNRHPMVDGCVIRVGQQAGANRLIAHIKLANGRAPTEVLARDIDAWCRANLRPQERPRIYNFDAVLPTEKTSR